MNLVLKPIPPTISKQSKFEGGRFGFSKFWHFCFLLLWDNGKYYFMDTQNLSHKCFILLVHQHTLWAYFHWACLAIQMIQKKGSWYVPKFTYFSQKRLTSIHYIHCFFQGLTCPFSSLGNYEKPIYFCWFVCCLCTCKWNVFVIYCWFVLRIHFNTDEVY